MSNPNDDRWAERGERAYSEFTDRPVRTAGKWYLWLLAAAVALALLGGVIGLIGGWFSGSAELVTFQHSKEQVTAVLNDWESMKVAASNVCDAQDAAKEQGDPTFIEDPAFAYKATYRRIEADYDRRMGNLFEAAVTRKLPLPASINHLPKRAPTLDQALVEAGCPEAG